MPFIYNPFTDNLDNTRLAAFPVPANVATSYPTDAGTAIPALNILQVLGGTGLSTTGATNVVTVNLDVPVVVSNGGTGKTTLTDRGLVIGRGTTAVDITAAGTNGQVVIAATGANPAFATITSTGSTVAFTLGANTLNLETGSSVAKSFNTDSGTATPSAGVLSIVGSHGINTTGATNVVTIKVNNSLTLGDLSAIGAGSSALTATTGDITITSGNLNIPSTTSADVGVINQGGNRLLFCYPDFRNTFVGVASGNFSATGIQNVGVGNNALQSVTSGSSSTCVGLSAGQNLTSGGQVTAVGAGALANSLTGDLACAYGFQSQNVTTSSGNNSFGFNSLALNVSGISLSAFGSSCLLNCTGSSNSAFGNLSCRDVTSGARNSSFGDTTLVNLETGTDNIALGYFAGQQLTLTDSSNILIGNIGTTGDNNKVCIGTQGTGSGQQDSCFIAGIVGVTNSNAVPVTINSSTGQLGVGTNSSIVSWNNVTTTSATMVAGQGYQANNAGLVTLTMPSVASSTFGDTIRVSGLGAGGWKIQCVATQLIHLGSSATSAAGSLASTNRYDSIDLVCSSTTTEWFVMSSIGSLTVV